jgi:hypothetical protein
MELSDFIMLNAEEKKLVVLHDGVLIGKRKTPESIIFLFDLHKFYVETFCSVKTKEVSEYRMFAQTGLLQPYLETIAIDQLLKE